MCNDQQAARQRAQMPKSPDPLTPNLEPNTKRKQSNWKGKNRSDASFGAFGSCAKHIARSMPSNGEQRHACPRRQILVCSRRALNRCSNEESQRRRRVPLSSFSPSHARSLASAILFLPALPPSTSSREVAPLPNNHFPNPPQSYLPS